jgi:hypothetical protein
MTSSPKQRKKKLREKQAKRQARLTERRLEQFSPLQTVRMSEVIGHLAEPIVEEMVDSIDDSRVGPRRSRPRLEPGDLAAR